MVHGINHAKQIVIGEAECLVEELQNGGAGCVETQGKAIALIVKMITPLYEADFVTAEECQQRHNENKSNRATKLKIGPIEIEGLITTTLLVNSIPLICSIVVIYMTGKGQNWW